MADIESRPITKRLQVWALARELRVRHLRLTSGQRAHMRAWRDKQRG